MERLSRVLVACCLLLGSCCDEDFIIPGDELDYDFYAGALDLTSMMNTCSADAAYTTIGATPDRNAAECWDNYTAPVANRWFKVQAPDTGELWVTLSIGSNQGTQLRSQIALWEADATTELGCESAYYDQDNIYFGVGGLTIGEYYYLSVDVADIDAVGTFTLCVSDAD